VGGTEGLGFLGQDALDEVRRVQLLLVQILDATHDLEVEGLLVAVEVLVDADGLHL